MNYVIVLEISNRSCLYTTKVNKSWHSVYFMQLFINKNYFLEIYQNLLIKWGTYCLIIFALSGCSPDIMSSISGSLFSSKSKPLWLRAVSIQSDENINDFSPVKVHVVFAYEQGAYDKLIKMTADSYFDQSEQLKEDFNEAMQIFEWDVIRGQIINDQKIIPQKPTGSGIIVFANYLSPGMHRKTVGTDEKISIRLHENDFELTPQK